MSGSLRLGKRGGTRAGEAASASDFTLMICSGPGRISHPAALDCLPPAPRPHSVDWLRPGECRATPCSQDCEHIDEIAFQMSIRALNAALEAARAGKAGAGFAAGGDEERVRGWPFLSG